MAKVDVQANRTKGKDRDREETGRDRGRQLAPRGLYAPSFFSLSPRDLARTSPFELMRRFTDQLDRAFEGFGSWGQATAGDWAPPVEAFERDGKFVVRAELPGMDQKDVKVELAEEGLIIKGERRSEHDEKGEGFYRSEWSYGQFQRFVPLPYMNADVDQARARFDNGVLEVTIPVPEGQASQRRQIPVQAGSGEVRGELKETRGRS
jgi:HSP20 family protein